MKSEFEKYSKIGVIVGLILSVVFIAGVAFAAEISIETIGSQKPNEQMYTSNDYRIQLSTSGDLYGFVAYEELGVCTGYCGTTFNLLGVGFGKTLKFEKFELYGQLGVYYVEPTLYASEFNENLHYYFRMKFRKNVEGIEYRMDNGNGFEGQVGAKIPFTKNSGMKVYYRSLQFKMNPVMQFESGKYWHDPFKAQFNGFGFGYYYKF